MTGKYFNKFMTSDFKKYIISEVQEIGEIGLFLLIPKFLEICKKQEVYYPLDISSYGISEENYLELVHLVKELVKGFNLFFYIFIKEEKHTSRTWEEAFRQMSELKVETIYHRESYWNSNNNNYIALSDAV